MELPDYTSVLCIKSHHQLKIWIMNLTVQFKGKWNRIILNKIKKI